MKAWSDDWALQVGPPNFFSHLWNEIDAYYRSGSRRDGPIINFEKVLGEMIALAHWMEPAPWGDTLRATACEGMQPPSLAFPMLNDTDKYGATVPIIDQLGYLSGQLAKFMRLKSSEINKSGQEARRYADLFGGLRDAFDVGVYNLNYDTAALAACPGCYTGFDGHGDFDPREVHRREDWGFVYHLHGSVHHSFERWHGGSICWRDDLTNAETFFDVLEGNPTERRSEGKSFPQTTLIAGGHKLDQLLVEPFHSLYTTLVRHIYEADAVLIGGYGLGDVHVNRALRNRYGTARTRVPTIVLDFAGPSTNPMTFRQDAWSRELSATLLAPASFYLEPGHPSPPRPQELAEQQSFEVSHQHRVALWYGGFTVAAKRLDGILPWLLGAPDEILIPPPGVI
jgi:hypothetical protein